MNNVTTNGPFEWKTRNGFITFPAGQHRLTDEQLKAAKKAKVVEKTNLAEPSTIQQLKTQLGKADRQLALLADENEALKKTAAKSDALQSENTALKAQLDEATTELERQRDAAETGEGDLANKVKELETENAQQAELLAEAQTAIETLTTERDAAVKELSDLKAASA